MTQNKNELTGLQALKILSGGKPVYDFCGMQYEMIDNHIYQKNKKANGQEYYVLCVLPINVFLSQYFKKEKL